MRAPRASGTFSLDFDLVQDGVGWFSGRNASMKTQTVVVGDGVTFYGTGWGHGIGLSQWGAQGWAEGAAGPRLTGEQIVEDYGHDIGSFVSMAFNLSPGGRRISVQVRGTGGSVDLKGDRFLRTTLGMKSTLVRTTPF